MTGFWSSETMQSRLVDEQLVAPFDPDRISNCSYELSMGPQALLTGEEQIRRDLDNGEQHQIAGYAIATIVGIVITLVAQALF